MQTSGLPTRIAVPFADAGTKNTIPVDSQIGITGGAASFTTGFPPLTMTPVSAGGIPPFGADFNGILNAITNAIRWNVAGSGYPFDSTFATAVTGYPKGALLPASDFSGYWLNTQEANTTTPENSTAATTGWVPGVHYGATALTGLSSSSVTLTTLQAAKTRINLSGTLTANINLVFPAWVRSWTVANNCTGNFSVTCKTPAGTGVTIPAGLTAVINGDGTNITQDTNVMGLPGRLIAVKYLASNTTYTPTVGTNSIFVKGVGTGGNGGGSTATNSTSCTACSGGASGSYAEAWYTSGFSSVVVTIGAIGPASYASGSAGGTSSFGSLMVLPGGGGGPVSPQTTSVPFWSAGVGSPGASPTLSGQASGIGGQGQPGFNGQVYSGTCNSGLGGSSSLGGGGINSSGGAGGVATGYGAGGGGAGMPPSTAQTYGGNGSRGIFIVWEYA